MTELQELSGKPLFGNTKGNLEKQISSHPLVDTFTVRRKLPNMLKVGLKLKDMSAILRVVEGDEEAALIGVSGDKLVPIALEDRDVYPDSVLRVTITSAYAAFLDVYGVDSGLTETIRFLDAMEGDTSLITTVKLDNNRIDRLGKVTLELASLHAQVCVREEVAPDVLKKAIDVVVEAERSALHLDGLWTRYDLYASGLVRRKRRRS